MNGIGKGMASLGVCAVGVACLYFGEPSWCGVVVLLGLVFIWQ